MLNTRFSLSHKPKLSLSLKPHKPVRETITYPRIIVTANNDSCVDASVPFEHVLSCGHLITTATPDEPCAPNCYHVENTGGGLDRSVRSKKVKTMKNGREISTQPFYCDACIETENEALVPSDLTSQKAEEHRAVLCRNSADKRGKTTRFRKCYIGLKITSVPCHSDGSLSSRYAPRRDHHVFDVALPQSGENMFEDVDPAPLVEENEEAAEKTTRGKTLSVVEIPDGSDTEDDEITLDENQGRAGDTQVTVPNEEPRIEKQTDLRRRPTIRKKKPHTRMASPTSLGSQNLGNDKDGDEDADDFCEPQPECILRDGFRSTTTNLKEQPSYQTAVSPTPRRKTRRVEQEDENEKETVRPPKRRREWNLQEGENGDEEEMVRPAKRKRAAPVARKSSTRQKQKKKT